MKKTLHIDETLLRDARAVSGAKTDTDTVRLGLEALVRQVQAQQVALEHGWFGRGQAGSSRVIDSASRGKP